MSRIVPVGVQCLNYVLRSKSFSLDWQPADTFESSRYASINLMWTIQPYLTLGVEYAYGENERADGTGLSNNRVALGIQIY